MRMPDIGRNKNVSLAFGAGVLFVFGIALFDYGMNRIGITDPKVKAQYSKVVDTPIDRKNLHYLIVEAAMKGEVATTSRRVQETIGVALAASLLVSQELANKRTPANAESLVSVLLSKNLLPGMSAGSQPTTLVSELGSISVRFRRYPVGIEVLSIGKNKEAGQGILIRIPTDKNISQSGIWLSKNIDQIALPAPFALDGELIAIGWEPDTLPVLPQ